MHLTHYLHPLVRHCTCTRGTLMQNIFPSFISFLQPRSLERAMRSIRGERLGIFQHHRHQGRRLYVLG